MQRPAGDIAYYLCVSDHIYGEKSRWITFDGEHTIGTCNWMFFGKECKPIYAGATPLDVFERIGKWMKPCPELPDDYNYE